LFFLVLLIACTQAVQIVAFFSLATSISPEQRSKTTLDGAAFAFAACWSFLPCIGPFLVFAYAGLLGFRHFYWALWCLVVAATAYAFVILIGLLGEYGMAHAAIAAAKRGTRYMNCGGHPRLFFILFAVPVTAATILISGVVLTIESIIRALFCSFKARYAELK
jgi:hypothetical protein